MRRLALTGAILLCGVPAGAASGASATASWAAQADRVCVTWVAKAKQELGSTPPRTPVELYRFSLKAKSIETRELAALAEIPARPPVGDHALAAMRTDIAEISAAIGAWNRGDRAMFAQILNRYLNDHRPRAAFAAAGAHKCG